MGISLLTIKQVSEKINCSPSSVCRAITGKLPGTTPLPYFQFGRRKYIIPEVLDNWIMENHKSLPIPVDMEMRHAALKEKLAARKRHQEPGQVARTVA